MVNLLCGKFCATKGSILINKFKDFCRLNEMVVMKHLNASIFFKYIFLQEACQHYVEINFNFAFVQQILQISKLNFHILISLSYVKFLIVTKMTPLAYSNYKNEWLVSRQKG